MTLPMTAPFAQAEPALLVLRNLFGTSLLGAYLHGSAVTGGLRPSSDLDILAIVDRPIEPAVRRKLLARLMRISGRPGTGGPRPLEVIVFQRCDLERVASPARCAFVYGEWLREAFEAGAEPEPASDPEFTLVLAQARREARTLAGADIAAFLPVVPHAEIRHAIGAALPALLASLEGDERNVLLTLARMWRTLSTEEFVPKDVAAAWAMRRLLPDAAAVIDRARRDYLGTEAWICRADDARFAADELLGHITAMLREAAQ